MWGTSRRAACLQRWRAVRWCESSQATGGGPLDTAGILAAPHRLGVEPSAALREIDFGAWEGRSLEDLWTEEPVAARAWERDIRLTPTSFGESLEAVERRVGAFWASLSPLPSQGQIAVVAHGGSLAVLRAVITGETVADAFATRLEVG